MRIQTDIKKEAITMNTAQPIRSKKELDYFKNYYKTEEINPRNQVLITIGLNTALRISSSGIQNSQKGRNGCNQ